MSPPVQFLDRRDNGDRTEVLTPGTCSGLTALGGRGQQGGPWREGGTHALHACPSTCGVSHFLELGSQTHRAQQHCPPTVQTRKVEGTMASSPMMAATCRALTRRHGHRIAAHGRSETPGHGPRPRHTQHSSAACGTCGRASWNSGATWPRKPLPADPCTPLQAQRAAAPRCAGPLQPGPHVAGASWAAAASGGRRQPAMGAPKPPRHARPSIRLIIQLSLITVFAANTGARGERQSTPCHTACHAA